MLAYLFFHRALGDINIANYEEGLRRFHEALAKARVPGFVSSRTYRVDDRYCDWYLVETSAALDSLNDAAVSGSRSPLHDAVARHATDGAGKLLKLAAGVPGPDARFEIRFSKPQGMSYRELYSQLMTWTDRSDVSLWRRMMVLGPPPEFCLLAPSDENLPADFGPAVYRREPI